MVVNGLAGLRVVSFEARRAEELATMLGRQGADVLRAPALREAPLPAGPEALELARRLEAGEIDVVILLTGVGTRALVYVLADSWPCRSTARPCRRSPTGSPRAASGCSESPCTAGRCPRTRSRSATAPRRSRA